VDRAQKAKAVENIKEMLSPAHAVVVLHYKGMTVAEITELRRQARAAGAGFKVTKNRLTKIAVNDTKFAHLADLLTGPTAISFSEDAVAAAKIIVRFAKDNEKLVILGGALGDKALDVNAVKSLAELPSLDELRSRLIAMIQTPATRIAGVLAAPAGGLARVTGAYAKKGA